MKIECSILKKNATHSWRMISSKSEVSESERKQKGFSVGSDSKESAFNAGDPGLVPGSEISPGKGNGKPLQCSCLEDPMNRVWWVTVHEVAKSLTGLSD